MTSNSLVNLKEATQIAQAEDIMQNNIIQSWLLDITQIAYNRTSSSLFVYAGQDE